MLKDTKYDHVKLLYSLSKICWFLEKHAIQNAENAGQHEKVELLEELRSTLNDFIERFGHES